MKFIRCLLLFLVIVAAIFTGVGLVLPGSVHVERSAVIEASPGQIFPFLNDFRKFNSWSPWAARDPGARYAFAGPHQGAGAAMSWKSEKHGTGRQQIIASVPDQRVVTSLDLGEMGSAQAGFLLAPEDAGTRVTWTLDSDLPYSPIARWFALMFPRWIGADYDEGLARLKGMVEKGAA